MIRFLLLMIVGLSVSFAACEKREPAKVTSSQEVKDKAADAVTSAGDFAKQEKDEFVNTAQKEIDELKVEIDKLKLKAQNATAKTKTKLDAEVKQLEAKGAVAEKKLAELKAASVDAWKDFKVGVDNAVNDLRQAFSRSKKESG